MTDLSKLRHVSTSFVGRKRELAELARLLGAAEPRLLTLVGPAGSGKTRVALEVARLQVERFPDGVWFAGLETLANADFVDEVVARALAVKERPGQSPAEAVVDRLRHASALLILDNCEHVRVACASIARVLLSSCPGVRILATSREPLDVDGELPWPVEPLALPADPSLDAVRHSDAGRLFVERAGSVAGGFDLTAENAAAVAAICRDLDGLPLAIELAAARTRLLSVDQIAARLGERFRLLTSGPATTMRHRTLVAAIDWSYRLLSPAEQALFTRLSVFAGGFTLEAAEAVADDALLEGAYLVDLLERLVDRSLVVAEREAGAVRFRMLESLRGFGRERLLEEGAAADASRRHAEFYAALVHTALPQITGPRQQVWLDRLEREHDNLRAAYTWMLDGGQTEEALLFAGSLWRFWYLHGHLSEGRARLEAALTVAGSVPAEALAVALQGAGWLAKEQADFPSALAQLTRAVALRREVGNELAIASALSNLASVLFEQGRYDEALPLYEEGLAIYRRIGDRQGIAIVLNNIGQVLPPSERDRAGALYQESLALCRALNDLEHMVPPLNNLGLDAFASGDLVAARAYYTEALDVCRAIGYRYGVALLFANLGHVARARGDPAEARSLQLESLAQAEAIGHTGAVVHALRSLAMLAVDAQDWSRAAKLFGAAETLGEAAGVPVAPPYATLHTAAFAVLTAAPNQSALRLLWMQGAALSLAGASDLARSDSSAESPKAGGARAGQSAVASAPVAPGGSRLLDALTRREVEVLQLVVVGCSNKEIARSLTLSVRTVEHHIAGIYAKLGAHTRGEVIGAALRAGLDERFPHS